MELDASINVAILGIVGSPRKGHNTEIMVEEALRGAESLGSVKTELYSLSGKKIAPCDSCFVCVSEKQCIISDDFQAFANKYLEADGVIIGSPVYHLSISAQLKAALDRLGNAVCAKYDMRLPRFCKAGGAVVQGASKWGGQEYAVSFIINHLLLMRSVPVSPDLYLSESPGASGRAPDYSIPSMMENKEALAVSYNLGRRVAEMAKILKMGVSALKTDLPNEYFPSKFAF
jgi:multimeric flavodoxin WrbA